MSSAKAPPAAGTLTRLDELSEKSWVTARDLSREEYARALELYVSLRGYDRTLLRVREAVSGSIEARIARTPRDIGSFGLGLNLATSDIDLGVGCTRQEWDRAIEILRPCGEFLGEQKTRFSTTRLGFALQRQGVRVDLSVLREHDFDVACRMIDCIDVQMTEEERVVHTWVKHLLIEAERLERYAEWKMLPYRRFCPEFKDVPTNLGPR